MAFFPVAAAPSTGDVLKAQPMKRPSCQDCRHCKVREESGRPGEPQAYCGKDAWPDEGRPRDLKSLFGTRGAALAARLADGCLHYEDMAG